MESNQTSLHEKLKKAFGGVYIANQNLTSTDAERLVATNISDAVAFGKLFIANPDLVERLRLNTELNIPRPELFYFGDDMGYTDYPLIS